MQTKHERLLTEAADAAKSARLIVERAQAEDRELTAAERATFDQKFQQATNAKAAADQAKRDDSVIAKATALAAAVDGPADGFAAFAALSGDGNGRSAGTWAKAAADQLEKSMQFVGGRKSLVSGSFGLPNVIDTEINSLGKTPTTLLDLIPAVQAKSDGSGGNSFTFLRQTTRTNNAAIVADGDTKPTSVYTIEDVEDKFRVIAHLSEAIPLRYFADFNQLQEWLESEMDYGLRRVLENQVLSGEGVTEGPPETDEITGILNTSGIGSQAFVTDVFQTCRKAKTTLETTGETPTAFVFSPADSETLDLAQDSSDRYYGSGPFNSGPGTLWGVPRVTSTALSTGTAILADWRQADLVVREGTTLAVDTGGDLFDKNQVKMRVEGRFGFAVKRPGAFVKITTTSG